MRLRAARSKASRAAETARRNLNVQLSKPFLMLVTDRQRCRLYSLLEAVDAAVSAGIDAVQLREKDLASNALYELALELRRITPRRCLLIVNTRLDVALASGADGVHLPEDGLPVEAAVRLAPQGFLVGRSVHSADGARTAESNGATYVQLGTIFATESKPGLAPSGLELVQAATDGLRIPCLAVGGVDASNAGPVVDAGAQGVAVVSAILQAEDVAAAVAGLRSAMDGRAGAPKAGVQVS
jgi:thiamine-phosphate pyrophosphorylase